MQAAVERGAKSGQAVLELAVGLFALVLALVAIVSFGLMGDADSRALLAAQREALDKSADGAAASAFSPLSDVAAGPDGRFLTPDDEPVRGSLAGARSIAARAAGPETAAALPGGADAAAAGGLLGFAGGSGGAAAFGFNSGEGEVAADLPPAATALLGLGSRQSFRHEAWMPSTGGVR